MQGKSLTATKLREIVNQRMDDPWILGRLACNLRSSEIIEQRHRDKLTLTVFWRERLESWRCTIFLDEVSDLCLAQIDLHNDATVRVELFAPCSVTISPTDNLLCLTRYSQRQP